MGVDIDKDIARAKSYLGLVPQEFNLNIFEPPMQILTNQAGYYGIGPRVAKERAVATELAGKINGITLQFKLTGVSHRITTDTYFSNIVFTIQ